MCIKLKLIYENRVIEEWGRERGREREHKNQIFVLKVIRSAMF